MKKLAKQATRYKDNARDDWSHTRTRRGEERRLRDAVLTRRPRKQPVKKKSTPAEEEATPKSGVSSVKLGTFVDIRNDAGVSHGIIIGEAIFDRRNFVFSLLATGDVIQHTEQDIFVAVPGIVPYDTAARCGYHTQPGDQTQVNARVTVLKRLRELDNMVTRTLTAFPNDQTFLHRSLRSLNPDDWTQVKLQDAVGKMHFQMFKQPPKEHDYVFTLAVHRYMMSHPELFIPHPSFHRMLQTFDVRPQSHVEKLQVATDLLRRRDPAFDDFIKKAKKIMEARNDLAHSTWHEPPSRVEHPEIAFTPEDRAFLDVIRFAIPRNRGTPFNPYITAVTRIVKALDFTDSAITDTVMRNLLVALGEMAPWDDFPSRERFQGLDLQGESTQAAADNQLIERKLSKLSTTSPPSTASTVLGPEDFYPRDPVDHLRHDFGNLPVYVVDDVTAEELDDGLSIEPDQTDPGAVWIRAHIADPTSLLHPTHVFSERAKKAGSNLYFNQGTFNMLPPALGKLRLSMGTLAAKGEPDRVLTFSYKVDATGKVVDYDVRAGLIRNIRKISYAEVDRILDYGYVPTLRPFEPNPSPPVVPDIVYPPSMVQDLSLLGDYSKRIVEHNNKVLNPLLFLIPQARVSSTPKPLQGAPINSYRPSLFSGFPSMTYEVGNQATDMWGARGIISECMKLACRAASRWLADRNIPMLRRVSPPPLMWDPDALNVVEKTRDANGFVDYFAALRADMYIPPVKYSLEPGMHWSLGIPQGEGYVRVTSPLRRYTDMVVHWQIKHAMLNPTAQPLFSREWLEDFGRRLMPLEREQRNLQGGNQMQWVMMYLKRWMEDPNADPGRYNPLEKLTGRVMGRVMVSTRRQEHHWQVLVPELGVVGQWLHRETYRGKEYEKGDEVPVQIADIQIGEKARLVLKPR
ncbi:RNB-domain-containing protein [Coniophora puteana RWD-64-598 SS2]|uniref:RNB-domain-containing protein n=1 Tax=Coniophora puteana (strain RWD-64-598) TaxID=741705 RepID=A0A5M3MYK9_CONPW|nr:RNB-domain-containing protein [Coniophora puteana RWD-64-598 SS2]EIW84238.1 RNB-domain-containing protein [Coniophora puteana RWD-64-598 SS2]